MLKAAILTSALVQAFANTNSQSKFYFCSTPEPADLTASTFAALTWVQVLGVGNLGETGSKTDILNYDTWDTSVRQKAKGITDAGSPTLEVARIAADAGQIALRAAALTNFAYAFKIMRNDPATVGSGTPTIIYNRGLVVGPTRPNGKNEDFDLEVFTLGLLQLEVVVAPT